MHDGTCILLEMPVLTHTSYSRQFLPSNGYDDSEAKY